MAIRQQHGFAAPEQPTAAGIELKGTEAIDVGSAAAHLDAQIIAANVPKRRRLMTRRR